MSSGNGVTSWSYSRWSDYDTCPAKFKYKHIDKLPEPPSKALEEGSKAHKEAEDYLRGLTADLPPVMEKFADLATELRRLDPIIEAEWGYDRAWKPTGYRDWKNCWLRVKLDAALVYEDGTALAGDWKTGKRYDANDDQMELFALSIMCRYPVKEVETRLWYLNTGQEVVETFLSKDRDRLIAKWEQKTGPMFADQRFAPRPNAKCRFCPYSSKAGGPCKH